MRPEPMTPNAGGAADPAVRAALPADAAFHHIGYATENLERDAALFAALGFVAEGPVFSDATQGIRGLFMTMPAGTGAPRIELLENLPGSSTLTPWLERGVRMYHLAYEVDELVAALALAGTQRARVAVAPVAASGFGGRRIAFVVFRHGLMLEFVERASPTTTTTKDNAA